jgi:PAS domain S-box-containing protein
LSITNKGELSFSHDSLSKDFDLLTKALDASITGIIITDNQLPDNPIIYCNSAFERMTGYVRKEIIGHNCRFLQKEDRNQAERRILREAVEQGKDCVVEIRNYKKSGTLFWNELYMSPIKDESGKITYFIGVQNDISRRRKAEQELRHQQEQMEKRIEERTRSLHESEEYLSSIVQTVRESLIVLDPASKVLSVNEHFLRTFKVSREETEGKELYELGNGQWDIPKLRELLEKVLPTSNPVLGFEVEHDFPHIGNKLMLVNAHRVEFSGIFKDRILIAIEDITDRREIEKRKDDFLYVASHELKTPLTTVKGYVQMMTRFMPENAGEKFKGIVAKTAVHVDRLNELIAELLDVSRLQSGQVSLHKEPFNFDEMIIETVDGIQAATPSHHITIKGKAGVNVVGDESHIVQVVSNLLSNAVKYAPNSKEVLVYVSLVSDYIKVSVTDYGMGITTDDQKRIFDRFYRVGEVQQRFPGMGIGLYVCDQIIKNHGGSLWVDSEIGKGSTFSFTLPLEERTAE